MSTPLSEVVKFAVRMAVFALPILADALTSAGLTEFAALASAVLAIVDKYLHERKDVPVNGLLPF